MRGYPGSGKSHTAKELVVSLGEDKAVIYSTDQYYHTDGDPQNPDSYLFDSSKLSEYHTKNIQRTKESMEWRLYDTIIIDNTNLALREMQPYVQLATAHNYRVAFMYSSSQRRDNLLQCFTKQTHMVPREVFLLMEKKYVYPNHTNIDLAAILQA